MFLLWYGGRNENEGQFLLSIERRTAIHPHMENRTITKNRLLAYVSDLPAGTFYTVSVPGGTVLSSDNLSGIIPVDGAAQAGFTAIPGSDDFEIVEGEGEEEGDV